MPPRTPATRARARRVPAKQKLTPQAEAELARQGIDTDSAGADDAPVYDPENQPWFSDAAAAGENIYGEPSPPVEEQKTTRPIQAGIIIDSATEPPDKPLVDPEKPVRVDIKTGPPAADEWLDFFSRIILKIGMELYTDFAFRGIDESVVTDIDLKRIQVRKEERDTIARPFAELATKTKWTRKHGRQIVAATDSLESAMTLGIWMRRVNRIAKKYRPKKEHKSQVRIREPRNDGDFRPDQGSVQGSRNGKVPDGYGLYNPGSG